MFRKHLAVPMGLALATMSAVAAPDWDLATDYLTNTNPNGVWQYGEVTASPANTFSTLAWNAGTSSYGVAAANNTFIYQNTSGSFAFGISNGKISLESDWGNAAVRWTAPAAGMYAFSIVVGGSLMTGGGGYGNNFADLAGVKINGVDEAFDSQTNTPTDKFTQWSFTVALGAGGTVDTFVLNPGPPNGGNTQTEISVTAVPEPSTTLLLAMGVGALAMRFRRKTAATTAA